ncbi:MAG TPA: type II toxin-antitoxin system HicB family antitoxin [Desulfobacterales bacterium]|nr:MAG: type II toxin-antitoxin system HicB family antitoxin [Deltaproteobacteria bacterium]HHC24516.1 type II toxin-antitoxin system HicB family antitoxin [Desulfobacterales bacterium]
MRYTVLLHHYLTGTYEAVVPAVPGCIGKGNTRDEALGQLRDTLSDRLKRTEITWLDVDFQKLGEERQNPWLATAGMFADDPTLEPMLREIYSFRESDQT